MGIDEDFIELLIRLSPVEYGNPTYGIIYVYTRESGEGINAVKYHTESNEAQLRCEYYEEFEKAAVKARSGLELDERAHEEINASIVELLVNYLEGIKEGVVLRS